jgi:spore germination protein YaaH
VSAASNSANVAKVRPRIHSVFMVRKNDSLWAVAIFTAVTLNSWLSRGFFICPVDS